MNARTPRLHWIRKVLADIAFSGESANRAPLTLVADSRLLAISRPTAENSSYACEGDDPLLCPSWQLMRLTVASKS
jgi:hypothetical protein